MDLARPHDARCHAPPRRPGTFHRACRLRIQIGGLALAPATDPENLDATLVASGDGPVASHRQTASEPLPPRIGRYHVLELLGSGGMGAVYAAYDPELDRKIALKVLLPGTRVGSHARERLLREAQALARLSHPNVVAVHDVGTHEGRVFVAMEFVAGATLAATIAAQRPDTAAILRLYRAAGEGLAAAHRAGLVHREHKPRPRNPAPNTGAPPISSDPAELQGRGLPPVAPRCPAFSRPHGKTVAMATGRGRPGTRPRPGVRLGCRSRRSTASSGPPPAGQAGRGRPLVPPATQITLHPWHGSKPRTRR